MSRIFALGLLLAALIGGGLLFTYKTTPEATVPPPPSAEFGGVSLRLDYATSSEEQERGLSGRIAIPDDYGMLFIFPEDDYHGFWMQDMLVPIDIFWLDDKGQVVSFQENLATSTYPDVFYPTVPARYVLETAAGFAAAHNVGIGSIVVLKNLPTVSK